MILTDNELSKQDLRYMRQALALAARARGATAPNPLVGAVIVNKDGLCVGEGWHKKAGTPHAEVHALNMAGERAKDATVYVTLEPCSHYGRTGPCADRLIAAGVKRVVAAMEDPNPLVSGRGFAKLRQAGIQVEVGLLKHEASLLNDVFILNMTKRRPFVALKVAATLDGHTATKSGSSKWITGEEARHHAHYLRYVYGSVLTGSGTVVADNPQLNVRLPGEWEQPCRIVFDSSLKTSSEAKVYQNDVPVYIYTACNDQEKIKIMSQTGATVTVCTADSGQVDIVMALNDLYNRGVTSVLVESGAKLAGSFFDLGLIDKYYVFFAPKLCGGNEAPGIIGGKGKDMMSAAVSLQDVTIKQFGDDWLYSGYPLWGEVK